MSKFKTRTSARSNEAVLSWGGWAGGEAVVRGKRRPFCLIYLLNVRPLPAGWLYPLCSLPAARHSIVGRETSIAFRAG